MYQKYTNFYSFLISAGVIGLLIINYIELGAFSILIIILSAFVISFGAIKWASVINKEEKLIKIIPAPQIRHVLP